MASRMLRRLRRRAKPVVPTWRMVLYDEAGRCQVIEVGRKYRPTRKARALMGEAYTRFEIVQVASWQAIRLFGTWEPSSHVPGSTTRSGDNGVGGGP